MILFFVILLSEVRVIILYSLVSKFNNTTFNSCNEDTTKFI